jgi:hypothetical protein
VHGLPRDVVDDLDKVVIKVLDRAEAVRDVENVIVTRVTLWRSGGLT